MKVLIAEDESILANNIKTFLEYSDFEGEPFAVEIARNGSLALKMIQNAYDLLILDLKMPEMDGTRIIEAVKKIAPEKRPSVILITAYPGDYETANTAIQMGAQFVLPKPFELAQLVAIIMPVLKSRQELLDAYKHGLDLECNWTLMLSKTHTAFIHVYGRLNFAEYCHLPFDSLDSLMVGQQADVAGALFMASSPLNTYRDAQAKIVGIQLFEKLFVGDIQRSLIEAGRAVLHNHNLRLTFVGPRDYLRYPLEFLHDRADYLILKHPIKRFVTSVRATRGTADFNLLLDELKARKEKLKILLIASNTSGPTESGRLPPIDYVDQEIDEISAYLKQLLPTRYFTIDVLHTEQATLSEILTRLEGCKYHILHYAGHGYHDERFPDKSCLFFWEQEGCKGKVKALSISTLKNVLSRRGFDLRFLYLSCCSGNASSGEAALLSDNFLGIADGLIQTGIPAVLGFRWSISDDGARELAQSFYRHLFEKGKYDLSTALFNARCEVAGSENGQEFGDWLAPILIVQG